jgi:uncharacterized alkaline shock family protein YloU
MAKNLLNLDEGSVSYKDNVVLSIVNLSTQEISGVACISSDGVPMTKRLLNKNCHKGVIIEFEDNNVKVDVYVKVKFGYSVRDVAFRVQENIKSSIESMTDFKVAEINIHCTGVVFVDEEEVL